MNVNITQKEFKKIKKSIEIKKYSPQEMKILYLSYGIPIPESIGEINEKNIREAATELLYILEEKVSPVEMEHLKFELISIAEKEAVEISESLRERNITVKEVQEIMKKLSIPDYSKVTAKNKVVYVEIILMTLNSMFNHQCEELKRAVVEIKEERYLRCVDEETNRTEEVVTKRKKSKLKGEDLVPSSDIHNLTKQYFEQRKKKFEHRKEKIF